MQLGSTIAATLLGAGGAVGEAANEAPMPDMPVSMEPILEAATEVVREVAIEVEQSVVDVLVTQIVVPQSASTCCPLVLTTAETPA